jgi:hypothetical protein
MNVSKGRKMNVSKIGKISVSGEPKETAVSREIMPADGSDPALRDR